MSSDNDEGLSRTRAKRVPQQERSQARFEAILTVAMRLFADSGYEAVSMREIAREAGLPIASLYMYFPTKLSIVREIWSRYTGGVRERLAADLRAVAAAPEHMDAGHMIDGMIDLMVELQGRHPVFVEIWGCVGAAPELRALNTADTLATAAMIGKAVRRVAPGASKDAAEGLALVLCEAASSVTRLALTLPPAARKRTLRHLKRNLRLLYDNAMREFAA